ncbi:MAG: hypothetical protein RL728_134 [Bacteroidota bacterium]|jgi:hypothetical protein
MQTNCRKTTIIIEEQPTNNINVIVNDALPTFHLINSYINNLSSNLQKFELASNNIISNSAAYLNIEEVNEVNFIQSLTGNWQETFEEMNTIQQQFSANWQNTTEIYNDPIVDGGFF